MITALQAKACFTAEGRKEGSVRKLVSTGMSTFLCALCDLCGEKLLVPMGSQNMLGDCQRQPFHGVFQGFNVGFEARLPQRVAGDRPDGSQPYLAQSMPMVFFQQRQESSSPWTNW